MIHPYQDIEDGLDEHQEAEDREQDRLRFLSARGTKYGRCFGGEVSPFHGDPFYGTQILALALTGNRTSRDDTPFAYDKGSATVRGFLNKREYGEFNITVKWDDYAERRVEVRDEDGTEVVD